MTKKIKLSFPNGFVAYATLREKEEPECAQGLWDYCEKPERCIVHHTVSTGNAFQCIKRPVVHPITTGSAAKPIGNKPLWYPDIRAGMVIFRGLTFSLAYGTSTEPSPASGPWTAQVDPEYLDGYIKACTDVWFHTYIYHKCAVVTIERGEES